MQITTTSFTSTSNSGQHTNTITTSTPKITTRPTAQPPPRPLSPTTDDPSLGSFVKIYNTLYVFVVFKVLFLFSFGYRRDWKETHECFREFKNLLRNRASSFRLSSQLGVLVYIVKMVWPNNLGAESAKFVRGYSCVAVMSVMQTIEHVSITERLLRVAENAFLEEQAAYNCSLVEDIESNMSDTDRQLRRVYRRILSSISRYLEEDRRDHSDMRYSARHKVVAYKLAIQLKYTSMSNEAGVSSKWLAVDVGRIMLKLRILQANRFIWTESAEKQGLGAWFEFDHWEYATDLSGFVGAEVLASIKAAFPLQGR